jgi:hypothetical protein
VARTTPNAGITIEAIVMTATATEMEVGIVTETGIEIGEGEIGAMTGAGSPAKSAEKIEMVTRTWRALAEVLTAHTAVDAVAEAVIAIAAILVVTTTLLTWTAAAGLETFIEAVGELVPDLDLLTMIDTTALVAETAAKEKIETKKENLAATATDAVEARALTESGRASLLRHSLPRMSVIGVQSLCSSLLQGSERKS